jgi:hypothetical protein
MLFASVELVYSTIRDVATRHQDSVLFKSGGKWRQEVWACRGVNRRMHQHSPRHYLMCWPYPRTKSIAKGVGASLRVIPEPWKSLPSSLLIHEMRNVSIIVRCFCQACDLSTEHHTVCDLSTEHHTSPGFNGGYTITY